MSQMLSLLRSDLKNISRDSLLVYIPFMPLAAALVYKLAAPYAAELLMSRLHFDLSAYDSLIVSILLMVGPMMFGFVAGFLLLDERDEQILNFIAVTPLSKNGYLLYRILFPLIASFAIAWIIPLVSDPGSINVIRLIPVALMASLQAPMMTLFLAAFAGNKVEGLALFKGVGVIYTVPVAGYLMPSNWQLLLGIFPPYWVTKAFTASHKDLGEYSFYIVLGLTVHIVYMGLLLRKFTEKVD